MLYEVITLELEWIQDILKVDYVGRGTANRGVTSVGACIIANSKGAVIGGDTSGPELLKIEDVITSYSIHYTKLYDVE